MTTTDTSTPEWQALDSAIRAYVARDGGDLVTAWVLSARVVLANNPDASGLTGQWHGDFATCMGLAHAAVIQLERDLYHPPQFE